MSDRALRDELMTMLVAGQETSAILLGWACALLAHNPEVRLGMAPRCTCLKLCWTIAPGTPPRGTTLHDVSSIWKEERGTALSGMS